MKFIILLIAALLWCLPALTAGPAQAQNVNVNCATGSGGTTWQPASSTNPCPVTATVTSSAFPANVTPTDCSGTITSGGAAQNAFTAQTTLHGFTIANIDASAGSGEPLWISFTGTAAAASAGSYPLSAPNTTTFTGLSSFTAPAGFGDNHALSVIAATTGHKFSCTWW